MVKLACESKERWENETHGGGEKSRTAIPGVTAYKYLPRLQLVIVKYLFFRTYRLHATYKK